MPRPKPVHPRVVPAALQPLVAAALSLSASTPASKPARKKITSQPEHDSAELMRLPSGPVLRLTRGRMPVLANAMKGRGYGGNPKAQKAAEAIQRELAREIRDWRSWAKMMAESVHEPTGFKFTGPLAVEVVHLRKTAGLADLGAPFFCSKAVIDGVADAGVIPEDGPKIVTRLSFLPPIITGWHGLMVMFTPTAEPFPGILDTRNGEGLF